MGFYTCRKTEKKRARKEKKERKKEVQRLQICLTIPTKRVDRRKGKKKELLGECDMEISFDMEIDAFIRGCLVREVGGVVVVVELSFEDVLETGVQLR